MSLDARVPDGPLERKWDRRRFELALVSPARRQRFRVVVVGTGLAGGAAAATLAEQGYDVRVFCLQDSPRRAHSIAAQGGINAARDYANDGDSVFRLFHDTLKGGDFRSREANVWRLAALSGAIIDHCVALGVPFAREYGGGLDARSFGGAQVSRTFYVRGQTGQQLLLAVYGALCRQAARGALHILPRREMMDLVVEGGRARGVVVRHRVTGALERHSADAVILATGGYGNVFYRSTNALSSNASAIMQAWRRGAFFANPCFTQIHPTCIPAGGEWQSKLTLMSESLRNDGRMWVPVQAGDPRDPAAIPEEERDPFLERRYPAFGNLVPRDVASRAVKQVCDAGRGVGPGGRGVYLDLSAAIARHGRTLVADRYGNLLEMYRQITGEDPWLRPMRVYPAVHYTMGGLWVDYHLMSTIPGLFVAGEANFSDHGANRLGASALMQGLADGWFLLPATVPDWLAREGGSGRLDEDHPAFTDAEAEVLRRVEDLPGRRGARTPRALHGELGRVLWDHCGLTRSGPGLREATRLLAELRASFPDDLRIPLGHRLNGALERAARVGDDLELAELMCRDALAREESCGAHFREEHQRGGEPLRDDRRFAHVAAWEHRGLGEAPVRHQEPLHFETVQPGHRSYA